MEPNPALTAYVDEVGFGAIAHRVTTCALIMSPQLNEVFAKAGVKDSKLIKSFKKRVELALLIEKHTFAAIGEATPDEIDEFNLLGATHLAMRRAIAALPVEPRFVVVDGKNPIAGLKIPQVAIEDADAKFVQVGAASIVAKVHRDKQMLELHEIYPHYGWDTNMGYGTAKHLEGIEKHGFIQGIHRRYQKLKRFWS